MFNPQEVIEISKGAVLQPDAAWAKAKAENRTAMAMAQALTIPLVVVCAAIGFILGLIFYGHYTGWLSFLLQQTVLAAILGILLVFLVALVADYLAGNFGGTRNYNAAFNAVALASVPSAFGMAVISVPVLGGVLALLLWFYGLYLLYGALPVFLDVPEEKRMPHFICTLLLAAVATYLVNLIVWR